MLVTRRPQFLAEEVRHLVRDHYGLDVVDISEYPSERDQNFRIMTAETGTSVLKIANPDEDPLVLDFQNKALLHLATGPTREICPHVQAAEKGAAIVSVQKNGQSYRLRMLSHLQGTPLGQSATPKLPLLEAIGRALGQVDRSLASFTHPAMTRRMYWDSKYALDTVEQNRRYVADKSRFKLLDQFLDGYRDQTRARFPELRQTVIHNDANDLNLLVDQRQSPSRLTGLIDFGDMVRTFTICELANLSAYLLMNRSKPLQALPPLIRGYHEENPLTESEIVTLFDFLCIRLCLSVTNAARQKLQDPNNAYLTVSESAAWALLATLRSVSHQDVLDVIKESVPSLEESD